MGVDKDVGPNNKAPWQPSRCYLHCHNALMRQDRQVTNDFLVQCIQVWNGSRIVRHRPKFTHCPQIYCIHYRLSSTGVAEGWWPTSGGPSLGDSADIVDPHQTQSLDHQFLSTSGRSEITQSPTDGVICCGTGLEMAGDQKAYKTLPHPSA